MDWRWSGAGVLVHKVVDGVMGGEMKQKHAEEQGSGVADMLQFKVMVELSPQWSIQSGIGICMS